MKYTSSVLIVFLISSCFGLKAEYDLDNLQPAIFKSGVDGSIWANHISHSQRTVTNDGPRLPLSMFHPNDTTKKYIKTPTGYLVVLRQGDDVLKEIEQLAKAENIPSATYTGMGFVTATFGFFNFKTKKFDPKEFKDVELASMTGTIAWKGDSVSLHTHGLVTGKDFTAHGGHMLKAVVGTGSVEITIVVHNERLTRAEENPPGADVLQLPKQK
jgi:hypothetical protein